MVKNWCNVLSMKGVTVCGHHPECRVTFGRGGPQKLLASLMRNYFPKWPSGAPLHTLSKLYDVPVGYVTPPPYFEAEYCLFCGRRRVAVARYRMICLVPVISPFNYSLRMFSRSSFDSHILVSIMGSWPFFDTRFGGLIVLVQYSSFCLF